MDCAFNALSMRETVRIELRSGKSGIRTTVHMPKIVGSRLSQGGPRSKMVDVYKRQAEH